MCLISGLREPNSANESVGEGQIRVTGEKGLCSTWLGFVSSFYNILEAPIFSTGK